MEKAKAAVASFLHKDGKADTTVHETVNPAVQHETVTNTRREEATTAIDREVHQDHYHTSVQPILDREVLPEQHSHKLAATERRDIKHGDDSDLKERLATEQAQFKNTREVGPTQVSASIGPTVAGEHVHHHIHEKIQPVIQKETIAPSVIHTTVPIHEVHHNEAKHHAASALPPVTLSEYKAQGGPITGREERHDGFVGEPNTVGGTLGGPGAAGTTSLTADGAEAASTGAGHASGTTHTIATDETSGTHKKVGLMDKLNPKKDADGDGKAGFMS